MTRYGTWGIATVTDSDGGPCIMDRWSHRREDDVDHFYFKTHCGRNLEILKPAGTYVQDVINYDAVPLCIPCIATTHHRPESKP